MTWAAEVQGAAGVLGDQRAEHAEVDRHGAPSANVLLIGH
jgi:hypothetical protein